jgi:ATP-dependent Lhr-like helicase
LLSNGLNPKNGSGRLFRRRLPRLIWIGKVGLVNAPTGSGKTYSLWVPILIRHINEKSNKELKAKRGLQVLWITPLRALSKDLFRNMETAALEMNLDLARWDPNWRHECQR